MYHVCTYLYMRVYGFEKNLDTKIFVFFSGASFTTEDCISPSSCAIIQGSSTMSPWNDNSFVDPTAVWIWNTQGASSNAPTGVEVPISKTFYMDSCHPCMQGSVATGTVYVFVDDEATVYLNNVLVETVPSGRSTAQGVSGSFRMTAGTNFFTFIAENTGGPAGLLFAIYCQTSKSSMLLMHSDASWSTEIQGYSSNLNIVSYCPLGATIRIKFGFSQLSFKNRDSDMHFMSIGNLFNIFRFNLNLCSASYQRIT